MIDGTFLSVTLESDVGLVSMATGVNTASDSAIGTLTVGTFTRSQVTTGLSQFSEVSSSTCNLALNKYHTKFDTIML